MKLTMKPIVITILGIAALFLLFSCDTKQNDDITQSINKNGSIETGVEVQHLDSLHDILITSHKVWAENQQVKTITYHDTLPALGLEHTVAENAAGDTKNVLSP